MVPFELNEHQRVLLNSFDNPVDRDINALIFFVQPEGCEAENVREAGLKYNVDIETLDPVGGEDIDAFYDRYGYIRAAYAHKRKVAYFVKS